MGCVASLNNIAHISHEKKKYNRRQRRESNVTITYVPPETLVDRILGFEYESKRHQQAAVIYFKGRTKLTVQ